jgi:hypothetical protein
VRPLLVLWLASFQAAALACGICIDDKVASCYDHGVVEAAKKRGHAVAFFAIEGDVVRSEALRGKVRRAIESARGVRKGSARVSLENAALSFAYDPARGSAEEAGRAIGGELELRLKLLRILGPGA